jgi:transaldolase
MELFLECVQPAIFASIKKSCPLDGVLCAPSALAMQEEQAITSIEKLAAMMSDTQHMFVSVMALMPEKIEQEIDQLKQVSEKIIPVLYARQNDMQALMQSQKDAPALCAISSSLQALLAAKAKASYVIVYFNRLEEEKSALELIENIKRMISRFNYETKVLAAGFRNERQIEQALLAGTDAISLTPLQLQAVFSSSFTNKTAALFLSDWQQHMQRESLFENMDENK